MGKGADGLLLDIEPGSKGGSEDDEEIDAMKDFLTAVDDKDPKAMKLAFARAYEACAAKHGEPEGDEEKEY